MSKSGALLDLESERARLHQQAEEQRARIVEARAMRLIGQWRNGLLFMVLEAWRKFWSEAKRHRRLLARAALSMRNRTKSMVMRSFPLPGLLKTFAWIDVLK